MLSNLCFAREGVDAVLEGILGAAETGSRQFGSWPQTLFLLVHCASYFFRRQHWRASTQLTSCFSTSSVSSSSRPQTSSSFELLGETVSRGLSHFAPNRSKPNQLAACVCRRVLGGYSRHPPSEIEQGFCLHARPALRQARVCDAQRGHGQCTCFPTSAI